MEINYYVYGSILQETVATSDNVDVVCGPKDKINSVIFNIGERKVVNLTINMRRPDGFILLTKTYENITLDKNRTQTHLPSFIPNHSKNEKVDLSGNYVMEYVIEDVQ